MQTTRARSRIEAQGAITDDRDKHFDKCGCRCHVLPAPAPHLQDKCASVSYVSPCSIVAIIITSQSCALTIRAFNGDPRAQHLRYVYAWCPVHTTRSRRAATPRSESVPDTPTRGLLVPRAYQAADDLGPPLSGHFSFAQSMRLTLLSGTCMHQLTRPLRLPRSF